MAPRAGASGKKAGKPGAEEKREDILQAVVIADSFQTRFRPFSLEKPRCLLPLANTPLIEYTLEFLAMNGVQEVFIYCGAHQEQVEEYIQTSRWSPTHKSCPFSVLEFIRVSNAQSIGDFLRDLDKRNIMEGDFVLVQGDVVATIPLDATLAAHKARREANRDSCMTMVLREAGEEEHHTKTNGITPVFVIDPRAKRCLHYEEMHPLQSEHYTTLDTEILKNPEIEIRTDLVDAQIDICTPDVLALWSDSFDYELPRANFLHGILKDWELNGKLIHVDIVNDGYGARASNFQMYEAISRDLLSGWAYPFLPDSNLMRDQTYQSRGHNRYEEDDVVLGEECEVTNSMLGRDTHVGNNSTIINSVIGRNCKIGSNVKITDSFIWGDVIIDDGAVVRHAIIGDAAIVGKQTEIGDGSLLSFGVQISERKSVKASTPISLLSADTKPVSSDSSIVGPQGKGAFFRDPEDDEAERDDPSRLQKSLIYSLEHFNISTSSVSTLADEDDLADDDSDVASLSASREGRRSRLSSFASDDSGNRNSGSFHSDAVHGLLDVLRGTSGSFDSERLEFTSLRFASNASDAAMRRAVATAFVRRGVELVTSEHGTMEPTKAAKHVLTAREGAKAFVAEYGVGDVAVRAEQVEFVLALQKAAASSAKVAAGDTEKAKVGNLLAALLQQLYDLDIVEEEGILAWWKDARSQEGGAEMQAVRQKCRALVEWLEEADEESESGEDDDDED
ncbi:hypothetical protein DL771_008238 [Monosporascus sp. 5C6A]|nr:hypothetical protein DL771_008238 [Monosporascus sp. 5C6A]